QVELLMSSSAFPNGISAGDLALGPDGSVYVSGGGVLARRPSGTVDVLLASGNATALDVDAVGVVHVVQSAAPTQGFRIPPTGPIGPLIDASGDGQGHPLQSAGEVVVSDGPEKRIVVVGTLSNNAFLITDVSTEVVPLLGPAGWGALALALLGASALARRR
ncbi:MAG TPA: hypothetical protein VNF72_10315, partial [Myxococcota bacterium]|nr:hypothetical protein [Myxococcota bacterium]